jgi:hypothetical protein
MVTELEYAKEKKVFIIQKKDGERLKLSWENKAFTLRKRKRL